MIEAVRGIVAATPPSEYPAAICDLMRLTARTGLPRRMLEIGVGHAAWQAHYHTLARELEQEQKLPYEVWGIDDGSDQMFRDAFSGRVGEIQQAGGVPRYLVMSSREAWRYLAGMTLGVLFIDGQPGGWVASRRRRSSAGRRVARAGSSISGHRTIRVPGMGLCVTPLLTPIPDRRRHRGPPWAAAWRPYPSPHICHPRTRGAQSCRSPGSRNRTPARSRRVSTGWPPRWACHRAATIPVCR